MTRPGQRRESAYPQACASGCTDGDTHGASVKESFVSTLLHICERDRTIDRWEGKKENGLKLYVVMRLFYSFC
jgi:hypothetical protein